MDEEKPLNYQNQFILNHFVHLKEMKINVLIPNG
jgi:hypothetical protein